VPERFPRIGQQTIFRLRVSMALRPITCGAVAGEDDVGDGGLGPVVAGGGIDIGAVMAGIVTGAAAVLPSAPGLTLLPLH
jgi:hypothetical protein